MVSTTLTIKITLSEDEKKDIQAYYKDNCIKLAPRTLKLLKSDINDISQEKEE